MLGLHHHGNAARLEHFVDCHYHLRCQMLLGLQAACIDVNQASKLRQSDDARNWDVGDMSPAMERHHVMLAVGVEPDVAHQDKLVVAAHFAERAIKHIGCTLPIAAIELLKGGNDALWCVE